jgi:hypothetical protein
VRRGAAAIWLGLLAAACNVPLEHFHVADAAADTPGDMPASGAGDAFGQAAYIKASNTGAGDAFGQAVALSANGSTLVVGAPREAGNGIDQGDDSAIDSGAVYVFVVAGESWIQQAYLKARNTDGNDYFGASVAVSADGSTLAVGAYSEDSRATGIDGDASDNLAPAAGAVYVFTRSGELWTQTAYIKAFNTGGGDNFGRSIALSSDGMRLAVGAPGEAGNGMDPVDDSVPEAGAVYVFERPATDAMWSQTAYLKASPPIAFDQFGTSVALSAEGTLAVGTSRDISAFTNTGKVHVFKRLDQGWGLELAQASPSAVASGAFGNSVALSADGATLAVGASRETAAATQAAETGAVYMLTRGGSTWSFRAHLEASNPEPGARFGTGVALSGDGRTLAVGAAFADSSAAVDAGAIYLLTGEAADWHPRDPLVVPSPGAGDQLGASVALSADDSTLAAGAVAEDSRATGIGGDSADHTAADAGAVYAFLRPR